MRHHVITFRTAGAWPCNNAESETAIWFSIADELDVCVMENCVLPKGKRRLVSQCPHHGYSYWLAGDCSNDGRVVYDMQNKIRPFNAL